MKYYKTVTMAVSSVLAIAMLSGCGQKEDTATEAASEPEAAVTEQVDAEAMVDGAEAMAEDAGAMVEDTADKMTTEAKDAADEMATEAKDAVDKMAEKVTEKIDEASE